MAKKKYKVLNEYGEVMASNMDFDIALLLIRGYRDTYYNDILNLTIKEEELDYIKVDCGYQE